MTSPRHIAFVASPALSHVLPGLGLVRELVRRGHRVTYATHESMAEHIAPTGAALVPMPTVLPVDDRQWPEDPVAGMGIFLDDAITVLPELHAHYDADPADAYLYDIGGYAARALAEQQGRPFVQVSPTYVAWKGYADEVLPQMRQLPGYDAFIERFRAWLAGSGATTLDPEQFPSAPARVLALIPKAMQPNADRVDEQVVTFVGPCFALADEPSWHRPTEAEHVLLVSMGSAYSAGADFYRRCIDAFAELSGWHIVIATGTQLDPTELGDLPANVETHQWVPQRAVLAEATAFVTHAGMGGSNEGLLAGVPMIAIPQAVDQFMNADRLVELGVARRIDTADTTPEALRSALQGLLADPERARRSADLQAASIADGGAPRAADLVEGLIG